MLCSFVHSFGSVCSTFVDFVACRRFSSFASLLVVAVVELVVVGFVLEVGVFELPWSA